MWIMRQSMLILMWKKMTYTEKTVAQIFCWQILWHFFFFIVLCQRCWVTIDFHFLRMKKKDFRLAFGWDIVFRSYFWINNWICLLFVLFPVGIGHISLQAILSIAISIFVFFAKYQPNIDYMWTFPIKAPAFLFHSIFFCKIWIFFLLL